VIAFLLAITAYFGITIGGIYGFYWGNLIANYIVVLGMLFYLKKQLNLPLLHTSCSIKQEIKENPSFISFILIMFATSFISPLSQFIARFSVLTHFNEADVGLLQAAIGLATAVNMLLNPANGLFLTPILNRDIPIKEKLQIALEFQQKIAIVMFVTAMSMILFAPWLLFLLYTSAFVKISATVYLFIIAQGLAQLAGVYQALIIGLDDLKVYSVIVILGHLSVGAISWQLVPYFGISGVGIAFVVSSTILFLFGQVRLSIKHALMTPKKLYILMMYGLTSLLVTGLYFPQNDMWSPLVNLSKLCLCIVFAMSMLLFLNKDELRQLVRGSRAILFRKISQNKGITNHTKTLKIKSKLWNINKRL
jgi:O-antigen/teichoic acid export membrane protein